MQQLKERKRKEKKKEKQKPVFFVIQVTIVVCKLHTERTLLAEKVFPDYASHMYKPR